MARRRKKNIGWKIIVAILAFIGLLVLLDKLAGTSIFDTLYDRFVSLLRWIGNMLGGGT